MEHEIVSEAGVASLMRRESPQAARAIRILGLREFYHRELKEAPRIPRSAPMAEPNSKVVAQLADFAARNLMPQPIDLVSATGTALPPATAHTAFAR